MGESTTGRAIRTLLRAGVRAGAFPGAVAAWGKPGEPEIAVAGRTALRPGGTVVRPDTWYDLASLTKPLATTTLFLLVRREGRLDLGTRVGDLLPGAGAWGDVTAAELLTHTSGLPSWRPLYALSDRPADAVDALLALPPERPRGERAVYSCLGFILLAAMIETALGAPLPAAFDDRVRRPLGLEGIGFDPPRHASKARGAVFPRSEQLLVAAGGLPLDRVPALAPNAPDDGNARFLGGAAGNAGLFGVAAAVHELAAQYLSGHSRLLTAEEIGLATRVRTTVGETRSLGWMLAASPGSSAGPALSPRSVGHTGFTGSSVWVDPDRCLVLVLLSNRHHPLHRESHLHPVRRTFHRLASDPSR